MFFFRKRKADQLAVEAVQHISVEGDTSKIRGSITANGSGCRVIFPERPLASNVIVRLTGDNAVIDLSGLATANSIKVTATNGGHLHVGKGTTLVSASFVIDREAILIGADCMFSFDIVLRNTDAHAIYDIETGKRTNPPAAIRIEDHVWIGQEVLVGKGAEIGCGSIIGARSFVANTKVPNNSVAAGTPAKVIRSGVIWDRFAAENMYAENAKLHPTLRKNLKKWARSQGYT
ncbi:acyltransferase [Mycoplana ramosa]|uniref:Acyltransferase n=1 Tax=Mycoplana ramosa TaxID=40837 RepID=A0ABW3YXX0_MYCRA